MVDAVSFDAFGTIIDTGRDALIRVSTAVVEDNAAPVEPERFLEAWDRYFFAQDLEEFLLLAEVTEDSLERAFADFGIDADPRPYVEMLEREWQRSKPFPEVRGVLSALDGMRCAVVSNADDAFLRGILERSGLRFDVVVTSESAQCYKPRPRIFEMALEGLGLRPDRVVHVGDSLQADVAGAARLGMRTIWVNRAGLARGPGDPRPDFVVRDLQEVPRIVGKAGSTIAPGLNG